MTDQTYAGTLFKSTQITEEHVVFEQNATQFIPGSYSESKKQKYTSTDIETGRHIERDLGLALAPILRFSVKSGYLNGDFTDNEFNSRLWDVCTEVSNAFRNEMITPRMVKMYILTTEINLTWQTGALVQTTPEVVLELLQNESDQKQANALLARRF